MTHNHDVFETRYDQRNYVIAEGDGVFAQLSRERFDAVRALPKGARILDLGCGSGSYMIPLAQEGYRIEGLDFSQTILDQLATRWERELPGAEPPTLHRADARQIPCDDETFDAVYAFASLYVMPDLDVVLREISRVLKPDGIAILELGNARSLNAIESARTGTDVRCYHQRPSVMRRWLREAGLSIESERSFQLFPLWGGSTPDSEWLNRTLETELGRRVGGVLLDERIASAPTLSEFAFRKLFTVTRRALVPAQPSAAQRTADDALRVASRAEAVRQIEAGETMSGVRGLIELLTSEPADISTCHALAKIYDGPEEQSLLARWNRINARMTRRAQTEESTTPSTPTVSVVLPSYNQGHYLHAAIQSVLRQTYENFELIVIDDGSTDGTQDVLRTIDDPRVRCFRRENGGLPTALNHGFSLSRGELLTWISADNSCAPHMLERLVAALEEAPESLLAISAFAYVDAENRLRHVVSDQDLSLPAAICKNPGITGFLYRRSCLTELGGYREDLLGAEDWEMWLRMIEAAPAVYVPEVLYYYRDHPESMTHTLRERVHRASCRVFEEARERHDGFRNLRRLYPGIDRCPDPRQAEMLACLDFAAHLLGSPFAPPDLGAHFVSRAIDLAPSDEMIAANLEALRLCAVNGTPIAESIQIDPEAREILLARPKTSTPIEFATT